MKVLSFEEIDTLSSEISDSISKISVEIIGPLVKELKYDEGDIDILYQETRETISEFLSKNSIQFVKSAYDKGLQTLV